MSNKYRNPNIFDKVNFYIDNTEGSVINLLTAIAPWGAPTIPAWMTYVHASTVLGFPTSIAWVAAGVVEILGLSTVSTGIKFWKYNQKSSRMSEYRKAPLWIVVATFIYYMISIILSNVVLDATIAFWPNDLMVQDSAIILVKAVFTSLTLPAGLIIAVRQQHREILEEQVAVRETRTVVAQKVPSSTGTGIPRNNANKVAVFSLMDKVLKSEGRVASFSEVRDVLHIPQGSASRLRNEWIKENNIQVKP